MKKVHKNMLVFSILYWLLAAIGLILTGFSMQKVPIGFYGLRVHYFSSQVDQKYYTNGLYHTGVGYYFVLYPQPRSYVIDKQLAVINKDLEKITVTYTLCYRYVDVDIAIELILLVFYECTTLWQISIKNILLPYQMYFYMLKEKNIISSVFSTLSQAQSRVTAQQKIIAEYNTNGKKRVDQIFSDGLQVEAIWVNKLQFSTSQPYYDSAYIYSASSSPAYQSASYNLTLAKLQLNAANSALQASKQAFIKRMQLQEQKTYDSLTIAAISQYQDKIMDLSQKYNVSRVLNYYRPASFVFQ